MVTQNSPFLLLRWTPVSGPVTFCCRFSLFLRRDVESLFFCGTPTPTPALKTWTLGGLVIGARPNFTSGFGFSTETGSFGVVSVSA